jgi:hypothetical protein
VTITDHLQGWGTLAAVVVALLGLWVTARKAAQDQQEQFRELRDRERREFLVEQLQSVADAYAESVAYRRQSSIPVAISMDSPAAMQYNTTPPHRAIAHGRLQARLAALPPRYASLLKLQEFAQSAQHFYGEETRTEAERRLARHGADATDVPDFMIYAELADNIGEVIGDVK